MIAPLKEADVDVFVVLHPEYFSARGQAALLNRVRRVLLETYTKSPRISRNGQAVTITFTDFVVDVVPGFRRKGGGFLIPDSVAHRWIATDPKRHVAIWSESNRWHSGDLVPLIKMIKAWNKKHSRIIRSFHLETIVLTALDQVTISDFPSGCRFVFGEARALVRAQLRDPAGYGGSIGGYLSANQLGALDRRLETAFRYAQAGEAAASCGNVPEAFRNWRRVFGGYFPAYG